MKHTDITPDIIIAEVEAYCGRVDMKPSSLCVKVLGNSRFLDRLRRRREKLDEDAAKLRAYMAANPPAKVGASQEGG